MADPIYTSRTAQLLVGLERGLQNKARDTGAALGNPLFGLRYAGIDVSEQLPPSFPAALITPGSSTRDAEQELTWNLSIALLVPAASRRTALLQLCDLEQQVVEWLLDNGETLADGWLIDDAWGYDPNLISHGDPNNPASLQVFYLAVVSITARRLE